MRQKPKRWKSVESESEKLEKRRQHYEENRARYLENARRYAEKNKEKLIEQYYAKKRVIKRDSFRLPSDKFKSSGFVMKETPNNAILPTGIKPVKGGLN